MNISSTIINNNNHHENNWQNSNSINNISSLFENNSDYKCGSNLESFHLIYAQIHGWASLIVCIFGCIANSLNIAVLTRRDMRSPTNMILTGLAVADLLVMIEYVPYAIHLYLYHRSRKDRFTYGWAVFVLFHSNFGQVCHTISICLTLTLAIWRYIAVAHPQKNHEWCSHRRTIIAIIGAYLFCPILCVPLYITTEVRPQIEPLNNDNHNNHNNNNNTMNLSKIMNDVVVDSHNYTRLYDDNDDNNNTVTKYVTLYFVRLTETARVHGMLKEMNFWIYSVVIKLIPCLALTILSIKLVLVLLEAKERRKKLTSKTLKSNNQKLNDMTTNDNINTTTTTAAAAAAATAAITKIKKKKSNRNMDKERQTDRTTMMLLAVLLLFLLTELPQGVLGLLSVILGSGFFHTCYLMLGDVIDILTLINSAINFILYCTMSRQFRTTFKQLFCTKWKNLGRWMPIQHLQMDNNGNTGTTNHTVTQVTQV
ncbi:PREDICTED: sex peptide receptor-like [Polistes dominula]|uniref:Sex peptide receptor-like n=1 Tax=Polistes dominula TaxID=743375 RepID=A0ABM1IBC3_POLDO|nr:PREDICTED: sex peptide receptor-like [Polistes dominula]